MDVTSNEYAQMDPDLHYGTFDLGFDFSAAPTQENVSQKNILEFIESQEKQNTKLTTERDIKRLKNWLQEKGKRREIQNIPVDRLNWLLAIFSRQASLARQAFLITPLHGARLKTGKNAIAKK